MTGSQAELALKSALLGTGLVQPVDAVTGRGVVEVLCRQVPGQEAPWMRIVDGLLQKLEATPDALHIGRRYVRRNGQLVFGWHLGLRAPKAAEFGVLVAAACEVLATAKPELTPAAPARRRRAAAAVEEPDEDEEAPDEPARPSAPVRPIKVVRRSTDEDGSTVIEEEMPLPHVYRDLNRPAYAGARGARPTASSGASRRT
jgi:hypothetical protein